MANPIVTHMRARPALWFVPLALLLSWYPAILKEMGLKQASGGINPLGVLVAALILSGVTGGWPAVKALLARMVRVKVGPRWYLTAVLIGPVLAFAALALGLLFGIKAPETWGHPSDLLPTFLIMFLFVGLGEEPGWRGYLLPTLQGSYSALKSSLIVGVVWAVWHAPFYGSQVPWEQVAPFFLNVIAGSVVMAWIFNNARGSVFLAMLMHAVNNTVGGAYVGQLLHGADLTLWWWIFTALWMLAAGAIAWKAGPSLRGRGEVGG